VFDFRYHALSLAAVFIALVVGLLLGVAIGDKELVSSASNEIRDSLRRDVVRANSERDNARSDLRREQAYGQQAYPILTGGRLRGRSIGLVLLGENPGALEIVDRALEPTGASLKVVAVVKSSVDLSELAERSRGTRYQKLADDNALLDDFGRRMGGQMVDGGRLISVARTALLRSLSGSFGGLDGVIVMRSAEAPKDKRAAARAKELQAGIVRGLVGADVSAVGIETRKTNPSQVGWYRDHELSTVDNVNEIAGRAALVFVLAGSDGAFGRKDSAQGLLPPVVTRGRP
jgi:hypothetical protein